MYCAPAAFYNQHFMESLLPFFFSGVNVDLAAASSFFFFLREGGENITDQ